MIFFPLASTIILIGKKKKTENPDEEKKGEFARTIQRRNCSNPKERNRIRNRDGRREKKKSSPALNSGTVPARERQIASCRCSRMGREHRQGEVQHLLKEKGKKSSSRERVRKGVQEL